MYKDQQNFGEWFVCLQVFVSLPLKPHEGFKICDRSEGLVIIYILTWDLCSFSCLPSINLHTRKKDSGKKEKLGGRGRNFQQIYNTGKTKTTPAWINKDSELCYLLWESPQILKKKKKKNLPNFVMKPIVVIWVYSKGWVKKDNLRLEFGCKKYANFLVKT